MKIVRIPHEMKNLCATYRMAGSTIGLAPTMGALHEGHISLLEYLKPLCDVRVMTIFVNPVQFGPTEDFSKYPRMFQADCEKAESAGCDIVFAPEASDMYPRHFSTYVSVEAMTDRLCGVSRPGHFRGVTTVVLKFFNIIAPHLAVFGQKDAQQALVIKRMVVDLACPVRIVVAPTVREADGLAMSSRNRYLTPAERAQVPALFGGLQAARGAFEAGERSAAALRRLVAEVYKSLNLLSVEYIEIADLQTLAPLERVEAAALIAVAVRTQESKTRLIDNIVIGGSL